MRPISSLPSLGAGAAIAAVAESERSCSRSDAGHAASRKAGRRSRGSGFTLIELLVVTAIIALLGLTVAAAADPNWPQFRGPNGSAVSDAGEPPVHFGPSSNVLWSIALPPGNSSPVVWGDRIFLTAFNKPRLETLCFDRRDGKLLWRQSVTPEKVEPSNPIATPAASTPVTDGRWVYVYFDSVGLQAYDFDGKEQWQRPLPPPLVEFGTGTSPILAGDRLILNCDQDLNSHLLALDKRTGLTLWCVERPEFRRGFSTPFVWRHDGEEELIVPGSIWLKAYNLKDGSERWTVSGTSRVPCSSPTAGGGLLFSASWNIGGDAGERVTMPPFEEFAREHDRNQDGKLTLDEIPAGPVRERFTQMDLNKDGGVTPAEWQIMAEMFAKAGNALLAIRPGGHGDITRTHVVWKATRSLPYVASPLYHRGRVYTVKNGGLISCYDAKTGRPFFQDERLDAPGDYSASIVATGDRVFVTSQNGVVCVLQAGDALNILARNKLGETVTATPAILGGTMYLRTGGKLYAFGK
jgi:prepilin-type N-terminal cleavage/methylation domain-containing protein